MEKFDLKLFTISFGEIILIFRRKQEKLKETLMKDKGEN